MSWFWIIVAGLGGSAAGFFAAALCASAKRADALAERSQQDAYLLAELTKERAND